MNEEILNALLRDRTTGKNILWANAEFGAKEITAAQVDSICPRHEKIREQQKQRTRDRAEIFTPPDICALQNDLIWTPRKRWTEYFSKETEYDTEVLNKIAEIYRDGKGGVEPDGYKAIEYLTEIIRRNETDNFLATPTNAMKMIAHIWKEGKGGVTQDGHKAVEYLIKLTENNDSSGLNLCERMTLFTNLAKFMRKVAALLLPTCKKQFRFIKKVLSWVIIQPK